MDALVGAAPFARAEGMHYSQAVEAGGLVFSAGQGGFGGDGEVVAGGFEAQLRQAFANLAAALASGGASLEGVVKMTVYLADPADYAIFKTVRAELLAAPWPASTAVVAGGLLIEGMLVELDAVAVAGGVRRER